MALKDIVKRLSNRNLWFYMAYWVIYLLFFSTQRFFARRYILSSMGLMEVDNLYTFKESLITNLVYLPAVILSTHFVVNFLLPRFYFRNRFYIFSLLLGTTILLYPALPFLVRTYIVEIFLYHHPESYSFYNYFAAMLIFVFGMAPLAWFKIAGHLKADALFRQKIEHDKLEAQLKLSEAELKLLKGQIHPHFLFNTLNNLYSLSLEKSDKAPDLIIRLADMLSYIIYDCNSEKVPLGKEIDFIKCFIELQKVRYEECDISFRLNGDLNNKQIAPMILHTFVDNSFKHGADKDTGKPWINISIAYKEGFLVFNVINSITVNHESREKTSGIGIDNVKKRLKLIYPDRHLLIIDNSGDRHSVFLKIEL
jgi:two-component system, LytTR family, sensor kinase